MATFYSSFFSSGLLAASTPSPTPTQESFMVDAPSTPRAALQDMRETTPTATSPNTLPSIVETSPAPPAVQAPRPPTLRRRRSSLSVAASPVAGLKASTQRHHSLVTGTSANNAGSVGRNRARAGSVVEAATQSNSLVGRMRSGSIGSSLSRRVLRPKPTPLPAPTAPLPSLPNQPPLSPIQIEPSTPTRPLVRRSQTTDSTMTTNLLVPINTPPLSRALTPTTPVGFDDVSMSPMTPSPLANRDANGLRPSLNLKTPASMDYPSPIETPGEKNIAGYFWREGPLDEDSMKEN
ncbi:hypothetical protein K474DRAFT_931140 [Panus rudis PR-1116 ss-1]|nr:hypothetical protein K474DRAFT_931140 [Panus rudis PR-1116 ss-1]